MGIRFKMKPEEVWIGADDEIFDKSELGDFPSEERKKIRFLIYPLTQSLLKEVTEKHTKRKTETIFIDGRRETQKVETPDREAINNEIIDRVVKQWNGLKDEDGKELECNTENKLALMEGYPMLGACWMEAARWAMSKFEEFQTRHKEKHSKNSRTSQVGLEDDKKK